MGQPKPIDRPLLFAGQPIIWTYTPRGGYGYTTKVRATVWSTPKPGAKTVLIRCGNLPIKRVKIEKVRVDL